MVGSLIDLTIHFEMKQLFYLLIDIDIPATGTICIADCWIAMNGDASTTAGMRLYLLSDIQLQFRTT